MMALGGAALGYLLPGMMLGRLAKKRPHRIRLSLPDALDLLVVSVEAGLGLVNLELRAGKARSEALRNLADRTGVDDLSSLAAMLIQTDKFGTSVAQ